MRSSLVLVATPRRRSAVTRFFFIAGIFLLAPNFWAQIVTQGVRIRSPLQLPFDRAAAYRIHGKVSAIDPVAKTLTIAGKNASRTIVVLRDTVLIKDGAETSFSKVAIRDEADGIAAVVYDKLTVISMRFGPFRKDLPYAVPVSGKPGYVTSSYSPRAGYIDVTRMPKGIEAKDPYSGKIFLVP